MIFVTLIPLLHLLRILLVLDQITSPHIVFLPQIVNFTSQVYRAHIVVILLELCFEFRRQLLQVLTLRLIRRVIRLR